MENNDILDKLRYRRANLVEHLGQQIAHINELSAAIQLLGGEAIGPSTFSASNPFQGVPQQRIDTQTYLLIARTLISNAGNAPGIQRIPGAQAPTLITELTLRIREVNRIIYDIDRDIERLETRPNNQEISERIRGLLSDRDKLAAEVQFYRDLKEALENRPTRITREELQEQRERARNWAQEEPGDHYGQLTKPLG
jgi:hypothetical protein